MAAARLRTCGCTGISIRSSKHSYPRRSALTLAFLAGYVLLSSLSQPEPKPAGARVAIGKPPTGLVRGPTTHGPILAAADTSLSAAALGGCLLTNGFAYGAFRDGQSPDQNIYPSTEQIEEDLKFISRITKHIRIYSGIGSLASIPRLAKGLGISVTQGIYLSKDPGENEVQISNALKSAHEGLIDSIIVGNETLTLSTLSKSDLVA